eukprot:gene3069-3838_t
MWEDLMDMMFQYEDLSGIVIFDKMGNKLASRGMGDVDRFDSYQFQKYFKNKCEFAGECAVDLFGPNYKVVHVSKDRIIGFDKSIEKGFALEKTGTTYILGTYYKSQTQALSILSMLAEDFRRADL